MPVSGKIKALLNLQEKDRAGLANHLGISAQALNNKFYRDSFSAADLISIAEYTGAHLAFVVNDSQKIILERKDVEKATSSDE